jgi:hypothetical protein
VTLCIDSGEEVTNGSSLIPCPCVWDLYQITFDESVEETVRLKKHNIGDKQHILP